MGAERLLGGFWEGSGRDTERVLGGVLRGCWEGLKWPTTPAPAAVQAPVTAPAFAPAPASDPATAPALAAAPTPIVAPAQPKLLP